MLIDSMNPTGPTHSAMGKKGLGYFNPFLFGLTISKPSDEYLKYSFYPYVILRFLVFFMLNKCPNALNIHLYD